MWDEASPGTTLRIPGQAPHYFCSEGETPVLAATFCLHSEPPRRPQLADLRQPQPRPGQPPQPLQGSSRLRATSWLLMAAQAQVMDRAALWTWDAVALSRRGPAPSRPVDRDVWVPRLPGWTSSWKLLEQHAVSLCTLASRQVPSAQPGWPQPPVSQFVRPLCPGTRTCPSRVCGVLADHVRQHVEERGTSAAWLGAHGRHLMTEPGGFLGSSCWGVGLGLPPLTAPGCREWMSQGCGFSMPW